jgi:nucleotide-binding universal stress UspA family protein
MYQRILTLIDATPHAHAVLAHSRDVAQLTGARVHVLHVCPSLRPIHASLPVVAAPLAGTPMVALPPADLDAPARQLVDQAVAQLSRAGIRASGEVLDIPEEQAAEAIRQRIRELQVQLVVIGAWQRKRLLAWRRPSVADQVCHHPHCPVLIVP